jgi:probable F420-dependent oxidoreductase
MTMRMRFGAVFPTGDFGNDGGAIRAFATGVEAMGFDHLIAYDHVLGGPHEDRSPVLQGPYDHTHEFHEPFVLFGHLAAVTTTLELVVGVLVAPQRQTALIAKQAAEVQALSGGRLRLGLGTGWNWVEYQALGADFSGRGAALDEQVALLGDLWSKPLVTFEGDRHTLERAGIAPLPEQHIPLWFGGYSAPAYRRSVVMGDGHLFGHLRATTFEGVAALGSLLDEAGRDRAGFGLEAITDVTTEPDRWSQTARAWAEAGGTHLSIRTMPTVGVEDSGCRTVDQHLGAFERWRDTLRVDGLWTTDPSA